MIDERNRYRAWVKSEKRMYNVDSIDFEHSQVGINSVGWLNEHEIELMKSTGLRDKNGKLIFEGDIFKRNDGKICVVKWINDGWVAYWRDLMLHVSDGIEIIGNIHDTPSLLKGGAAE